MGAANFLVPYYPLESTAASIVSKIIFSGPVQGKFAVTSSGFSVLAVQDGHATSAIIDAIIVIPELVVSSWHFYELSQKPVSTEQASTILGEVAPLTSDGSRIAYAVAINLKDPITKQYAIIAMLACNGTTGGLYTAEAFLVK